MRKPEFNARDARAEGSSSGWSCRLPRLIFFLIFLLSPLLVRAADPLGEFLEKAAIENGATNDQTGDNRVPKADLVAGESQLAALGNSLTNEAKNLFGDPIVGAPPSLTRQDLVLILVVVFGGIIAVRKLLPGILGTFNPWNLAVPAPVPAWAGVGEAESFSDFVVEFRVGPKAPLHPPGPGAITNRSPSESAEPKPQVLPARGPSELPEPAGTSSRASTHREPEAVASAAETKASEAAVPPAPKPEPAPEKGPDTAPPVAPAESPAQFFATVAEDFVRIRKLTSQSGGETGTAATQKNLSELLREIHSLKVKGSLPELLPVWQVCAAVEGLLNQLIDRPANVNPSTLHTVAGAIELLEVLAVPGVKPELATEPPARILAVDDDAICRHAVSFALKKALNAPELASNGEAALALAEKQLYDVILLDVEMPGMDGFELCSRIRKTEANRDTPVVFVTRHSDYEARSKSSLAGGNDLIGKPFLIFEITVKALTLLLRGRLKSKASAVVPAEAGAASSVSQDPLKP
jgi:CheY-like chemotaxis protein